jgi:hypothetical protein
VRRRAQAAARRAKAVARAAARRAQAAARAAARRVRAAARATKRAARAAARRARAAARAVRKRFKKVGRRFKRFGRRFKKIRVRRPRFRRFGRRFKKIRVRRPRFRFRRRCFSPETPITLQNGNTLPIKDLKLGDTLINGSIVNATMQIRNEDDPYYKIHSKKLGMDIYVTGSHYVKATTSLVSHRYVRVASFKESEKTQKVDDVVSCLITHDHRIPVGEFIFWDWEDQKVN